MKNWMFRSSGIACLTISVLALAAFATPAAADLFGSDDGNTPPALAEKLNQPIPESLVETLRKASRAGLGLGTVPDSPALKMISGPRFDTGDKVGFFYMGADFCPYCAGQRWGVILTLLRFGEFDGLRYMLSSPTDVYPNTPTLSFQHVKYSSDEVAFIALETADRHGNPLMKPTEKQKRIVTEFDAPPYARFLGGIPFIYLDGQYMLTRPMLLPPQIGGKDWQTIAKTLANPQSKLFQEVMPRVNLLTAAICRLNGGNPGDVCAAPGVIAANGVLLGLSPVED